MTDEGVEPVERPRPEGELPDSAQVAEFLVEGPDVIRNCSDELGNIDLSVDYQAADEIEETIGPLASALTSRRIDCSAPSSFGRMFEPVRAGEM